MFGFSDLEERLLGPDGSAVLTESLQKVRSIAEELRTKVSAGLSRDDHAQAEMILAAAAAAEYVLLKHVGTKGTQR